ncbi:MAG: FG-GAP-like repeat-containing protein [Candidatus Kerfeldbacteria bacterium]
MKSVNNVNVFIARKIGKIGIIGALWALPFSVAAADISYNGCFERTHENGEATVWLQSPICDITVDNDSNVPGETKVTVQNLDPSAYQVKDGSGNYIATTRNEDDIFFTSSLDAWEAETYTISPWDYDGNAEDFWFVAMSDTQSTGTIPNPVFKKIMNQLDIINVSFNTISGDIIKGSTASAANHLSEYEAYDEVFRAFAGSSFLVPGDHDARQDLDTYYSAFYGNRDYSFVYRNTRFVGVNTTEDYNDEGKLTQDQLDWLEATLASATEEHSIVFMQHPLYPPDWADSAGIQEGQRDEIGNILTQNGVDLVITGDAHGYDYRYLTDDEIPGLHGGFYQLIAAGAGGTMYNYNDTDHFFVMVHVTASGIEHELFDYSDFDVDLEYEGVNDGSAEEVAFTIENNGTIDAPYIRSRVNIQPSNKLYASKSDGTFLDFVSTELDGVLYGYLEFELAAGESFGVEVKERKAIHEHVENSVDVNGVVTFDPLPTPDDPETELSIDYAEQSTTVSIASWLPSENSRSWSETTGDNKKTRFNIDTGKTDRRYTIFANGQAKKIKASDDEGTLAFTHKSSQESRSYKVLEEPVVPTRVAALPGQYGGSNVQVFGKFHDRKGSFFAYDKALSHGYDSIWADVDGDNELELVIVPAAGEPGHVILYETDGARMETAFPYGSDFTGGISLARADMNGDGRDEVIMAPKSGKRLLVKVYRYTSAKNFKEIDRFRAFGQDYYGGAVLTSADINADGDDEIIVGTRSEKSIVRAFKWRPKKKDAVLWFGKKVYTGRNAALGVTLASGDVDFNGRDDIVVGSNTGNSLIKVYEYQDGKRFRLRSRKHVFKESYSGGVNIICGDIKKKSIKDEIVVAPRNGNAAGGTVKIMEVKRSSNTMRTVDSVKPFKNGFENGITISLADIDRDWKADLVTAKEAGASSVKVYEMRKAGITKIDSYKVYDDAFTGGLHLAR